MITRTFTIPEAAISSVEKAVKGLARTAKRLGLMPEPTLTVDHGSRRELPQKRKTVVLEEGEKMNETNSVGVVPVVDCSITLPDEGLAVDGEWRVLAVMERADTGENEIFVSDVDAPKAQRYRSSEMCCDHCNANRNRSMTLLVENRNDSRILQVGRECADFYVGDRVEKQMGALTFKDSVLTFVEVLEGLEDPEGESFNCGALATWTSEELAANAFACVRERGWEPSSRGLYEGPNPEATSGYVFGRFMQPGKYAHAYAITEEDREKARSALAWLDSVAVGDGDTFLGSLKRTFEPGWVSEKRIRFGVTLVPAYKRAMEEKARADLRTTSKHVGKEGDKIETTLRLDGSIKIRNAGYRNAEDKQLYKFTDPAGNAYTWFTSPGSIEPRYEGKNLCVKATIADHDEWEGVKQTRLVRVKVLGEVVGTAPAVPVAAVAPAPSRRVRRGGV